MFCVIILIGALIEDAVNERRKNRKYKRKINPTTESLPSGVKKMKKSKQQRSENENGK